MFPDFGCSVTVALLHSDPLQPQCRFLGKTLLTRRLVSVESLDSTQSVILFAFNLGFWKGPFMLCCCAVALDISEENKHSTLARFFGAEVR